MAGYAVTSRIEPAAPRLAVHPRTPTPRGRWDPAHPSTEMPMAADPAVQSLPPVDLVGRPLDAVIAERLTMVRAVWSQTTFFLFDPNSWRLR